MMSTKMSARKEETQNQTGKISLSTPPKTLKTRGPFDKHGKLYPFPEQARNQNVDENSGA